jgi:hypothetical protein
MKTAGATAPAAATLNVFLSKRRRENLLSALMIFSSRTDDFVGRFPLVRRAVQPAAVSLPRRQLPLRRDERVSPAASLFSTKRPSACK